MENLKELIHYFYKYPMNFFPVIDKDNSFIGIILKKSSLKDVNDMEKLKVDLGKFISENIKVKKNINYTEVIEELKKYKSFPIISIDGNIEVMKYDVFSKMYLDMDDIDYKNILKKTRAGVLIFDINGEMLFKNDFFRFIEQTSVNFNLEEIINEIFLNIDNDSGIFEGLIDIDFDGVEISYILYSYLEKDKNDNNIIIASLFPKSEKIRVENNSDNYSCVDMGEYRLSFKDTLSENFLNKIDGENFSLKNYISNIEENILKTTLETLNYDLDMVCEKLKISKDEIEFKIKKYSLLTKE